MLIDNNLLIAIMVFFQTLVLIAGVCFYFYKNRTPKKVEEETVIEIEGLGQDHKGFGYVKGKSLVLNERGVPYLYKTYSEAKRRMRRVKGVDRIVFQQWDMATQTVLVAEVKHGTNQ